MSATGGAAGPVVLLACFVVFLFFFFLLFLFLFLFLFFCCFDAGGAGVPAAAGAGALAALDPALCPAAAPPSRFFASVMMAGSPPTHATFFKM